MPGQVIDAGDEAELPVGELAGVLAAIVLLLVVLRSVRAAFASMLTALVGVALGFALLGLAATGVDIPAWRPRWRRCSASAPGSTTRCSAPRATRRSCEPAATRSRPRSGRTRPPGHAAVTAAGIVLVAISGLLVTGIPFVGKVGVAAGVVVLVDVARRGAAPAAPVRGGEGGRCCRGAGSPDGRRATSASGRSAAPRRAPPRPPSALLAGASSPRSRCRSGCPACDRTARRRQPRRRQTQRQAYDRLAAAFGPGFNGPLVVAIDAAPAAMPERRPTVRDAVAGCPTSPRSPSPR